MNRLITFILSLAIAFAPVVSYSADSACNFVSRKCVDGPSTKVISGHTLTRSCWKYESVYSCEVGYIESDKCQKLRDKGCYETTNNCIKSDATGRCIAYEKQMYCPDGQTSPGIQDCSAKSFCMDGACFDTNYQANGDMAKMVTIMEISRQISGYMDTGIFRGVAEGCREGYGGIRDCCDLKPSGAPSSMANQALMSLPMGLASSTAAYSWSYSAVKATPYVYDVVTGTLGQGVANFTGLTDAWLDGIVNGVNSFNWNFSFAGFGYTTGSAAAAGPFGSASIALTGGSGTAAAGAGAAGAGAASTAAAGGAAGAGAAGGSAAAGSAAGGAGGAGAGGFYFSPIGFLIFIAVYMYGQLSSCLPEEQLLAQHRAMNVCVPVPEATFCSSEVLGSCVETKHMFCCYNSVIAKILGVSAHAQLGQPPAFSEGSPNCTAINLADIQKLDFNLIDFTEFYSSVNPGGQTAEVWQSRIDDAENYQTSRPTDCQSQTDPQKKEACMKSGIYEENGSTAKVSDRLSGEQMVSFGTKEFWQERAKAKIDYSLESGRANVQTNPDYLEPIEGDGTDAP